MQITDAFHTTETARLYDPTDDHAPAALAIHAPSAATPLEWLDWLAEAQRLHGICSESDCQWPIAGWCSVTQDCHSKLCYDHLHEHRNRHVREAWEQERREVERRDAERRDAERQEQARANADVYDDPTAW